MVLSRSSRTGALVVRRLDQALIAARSDAAARAGRNKSKGL
jgi:hypothetical protein